jgi:hypothetical protein
MQPLDTTPSAIATSALAAIPFDNLIAAPLQAAIKAQALAAMQTVDFIRAVGLQEVDGIVQAVNVTFLFQKGGRTVNLIVPLLTIVPIPFIRIDSMSIDFKANISATAATTLNESASSAFDGKVSTSAKWLFVNVNFDASYSSKKDSTATANSTYSVEYTMNVAVRATQDSMPAGLASILNILQESIAVANPEGTVTVFGNSDVVSALDTEVTYDIAVVSGENAPLEGVSVAATIEGDSTLIAQLTIDSPKTTDKFGLAKGFKLSYTPASPPFLGTATVLFKATVDGVEVDGSADVTVQP